MKVKKNIFVTTKQAVFLEAARHNHILQLIAIVKFETDLSITAEFQSEIHVRISGKYKDNPLRLIPLSRIVLLCTYILRGCLCAITISLHLPHGYGPSSGTSEYLIYIVFAAATSPVDLYTFINTQLHSGHCINSNYIHSILSTHSDQNFRLYMKCAT